MQRNGSTSFPIVHHDHVYDLVKGDYPLEDRPEVQPYVLNAQLNRGVRLESCRSIDSITSWDIDLLSQDPKTLPPEYDVLFVCKGILSEHTRLSPKLGVWPPHKWVEFMFQFWDKFGQRPLIMIGAEYDEAAIDSCVQHLNPTDVFINHAATKVNHIIKNARWFLGYQSGLGILAENFGVKNVMMYFNYLDDLHYAWNHPTRKTYFPFPFRTEPHEVVEQLWTQYSATQQEPNS